MLNNYGIIRHPLGRGKAPAPVVLDGERFFMPDFKKLLNPKIRVILLATGLGVLSVVFPQVSSMLGSIAADLQSSPDTTVQSQSIISHFGCATTPEVKK